MSSRETNLSTAQGMPMDSSIHDEITENKTTFEYDNQHDSCESIDCWIYAKMKAPTELINSSCSNFLLSNIPLIKPLIIEISVDKIIISQQDVKHLCSKIISNPSHEKLNSRSIRLVRCYGHNELIAKFLFAKNIIDQKSYESIMLYLSADSHSRDSIPSFRSGIYLQQALSAGKGGKYGSPFLVVHWSEDGCYYDLVPSYRKKKTDHQICFMSKHDLENEGDYEEDGVCYDFEVKRVKSRRRISKISPDLSDVGSDINLKRKGLKALLERSSKGIVLEFVSKSDCLFLALSFTQLSSFHYIHSRRHRVISDFKLLLYDLSNEHVIAIFNNNFNELRFSFGYDKRFDANELLCKIAENIPESLETIVRRMGIFSADSDSLRKVFEEWCFKGGGNKKYYLLFKLEALQIKIYSQLKIEFKFKVLDLIHVSISSIRNSNDWESDHYK
ncbi:hypothetical protein Glove_281g40 [Diversispora epigaea]|uniref:Uncharacterized protein n=1 Tax=Diversispora epigaea TaxID=1348612 RepID=A0A397I7A1_9GLOM|nr:hypothetical protein Glove_281g40 [Diversispora epigaea]